LTNVEDFGEPLTETDNKQEESFSVSDIEESTDKSEEKGSSNSTLVLDEDLIEDPTINTVSMANGDSSSGSSTVLNSGFKSVLLGVFIFGVSQLV